MLRTRWFNLISLLVVFALLLGAVQPVLAQEEPPAPEPIGLRPDAPPYGEHGPHWVGTQEISIEAGDHSVDVTVWYPALNPDGTDEVITYTIGSGVPNMAGLPISGRAIADSAPDTAQGPYPLVIFSPGLSAWRQANSYLLEHLASFGFVVMASDPRGETHDQFWEGAATRPIDTQLTIDYAEALTADDGALAGMIDMEHIATAGHSSGGWSALSGGGAQMDLGWCAANPELVAENELSNCAQFVPHVDQIANMLGLEAAPTGMWPPTNDPRVDAVIAFAPDGDIWGAEYEGVSMLKAPTLVVAGSRDTVNIPERAAYPIYEHLGSSKKGLLVLENADHQISFNQCRDTPWMVPDFYWACADAVWDMDRAHDLINHFATAFLLAELKGDAEAAAALAPENVSFPGVTYEAGGYAAAAPEQATGAATMEGGSGYVDNNGVKIYYEVEGEGPPLVLVHWASGSTQDWRLFGYVEALRDDYRLILIDMRGHGKSDKPDDLAAYDAATQASDIVAVLDELGIEQANYFGYSLGGRLGWALAKYAPERFQSFIIGGHIPFVWDDSEWAANLLAAGPEGWASGLVSYAEALGVGHPDLYAAYAANDLEAVALASKGLNAEDLATDLPGLTLPILLLAGDNDEMLPGMGLAAEELPNATMAIMPGLDHGQGFMLADQALTYITDFLETMNPSAAAP